MIDAPCNEFEVKIQEKFVPVWVYGAKNEKTLLLIHGFPYPFSQYVGDLPVQHLMEDYQIVAFDLPGFGKSAHVSLNAEKFIQEVITQLQLPTPLTLFGLSYGGAVCLRFAYHHPKEVNGIIIAGTPYFNRLIKIGFKLIHWPAKLGKKKIAEMLKTFSFLTKKTLSHIKIPVLLLYSNLDNVGHHAMGVKLSHDLPNAELYEINTRTHNWLTHDIAESGFLDQINKFLKKIY